MPRSLTQVKAQAETARRFGVDLLEVRLDAVSGTQPVQAAKEIFRGPIIASDHGNSRSSATGKLSQAAEAGADIVDIELEKALSTNIRRVRRNGAGVIVSWHDRRRTPALRRLNWILRRQSRLGADICKIVTTARKPEDNVTLLRFLMKARSTGSVLSFAMGKHGRPSRILAPLMGSEFSYASLTPRTATAPGQLTVSQLRQAWKLLGFD